MVAMSLASSSSSVLPETDSDVGMLSVSESESSGTGNTVSGPGVVQVSPRVSLLDRLRTAEVRSNYKTCNQEEHVGCPTYNLFDYLSINHGRQVNKKWPFILTSNCGNTLTEHN